MQAFVGFTDVDEGLRSDREGKTGDPGVTNVSKQMLAKASAPLAVDRGTF